MSQPIPVKRRARLREPGTRCCRSVLPTSQRWLKQRKRPKPRAKSGKGACLQMENGPLWAAAGLEEGPQKNVSAWARRLNQATLPVWWSTAVMKNVQMLWSVTCRIIPTTQISYFCIFPHSPSPHVRNLALFVLAKPKEPCKLLLRNLNGALWRRLVSAKAACNQILTCKGTWRQKANLAAPLPGSIFIQPKLGNAGGNEKRVWS